ncbi:MAG: hypothetical protein HY645_05380 [Acidobacteria bacterium]|nr:hypothetical protein [Acidobacteriota bacterium]
MKARSGVWVDLFLGGVSAFVLLVLLVRGSAAEETAILRGTTRSVEGSPLYGILVKAQAKGSNVATWVFSDSNGQYEFPPLSPAEYEISVGKKWTKSVKLVSGGAVLDFQVQLGPDFMNQTTGTTWAALLPGSEAEKASLYKNCGSCHSYWRLFDRPQKDAKGWAVLGQRMARVTSTGAPLAPDQPYRIDLSEENFNALNAYLERVITPELLGKRTVDAMLRPTGQAAKAVFTEWDLSKQVKETGIAWTEPKTGVVWVIVVTHDGYDGLGRLDMKTGDLKLFPSALRDAAFHDVLGDREGNPWITAARANKIVKLDLTTNQFKIWEISNRWNSRWAHTGDWDPGGNFWVTLTIGEGAVVKLNPKTGEVTGVPTLTKNPDVYGLQVDQEGNVWFTYLAGHKIGKIDHKTGRMTEYDPPTPDAGPRRIQMDSKGRLWFSEFYVDKVGMLDPKTMKWEEYDLGSPGGSPYFVKVDDHDQIWFNLMNGNALGTVDPETRDVQLFLLPNPDSLSRDAFFDYSSEPHAIVYGHSYIGPGSHVGVGRMYVRK